MKSNVFWEYSLCNNLHAVILRQLKLHNHAITTVQEFFNVTKNSENVVCHFYREETFRCKIMDKHLAILAKKHVETKFCKVKNKNIISSSLVTIPISD